MNIFFRELKASLKSLLIWCGVMAMLIFIGTAKFSAYYNDPSMLKMLDALPKAMVDAMSLRAFNLTTLIGFFGLMFIYYALLGGIAAAMWASDSVSKEERDKTVEFSLVLPVSRDRVVTAKALAAVVNSIIFVLVTWVCSLLAAQTYKPDQTFYNFLTLEMVAMFCIELIFLAVGLMLGCVMKRYKLSGSTAIGIILTTYFLSVMAGMQTKLDFLKYFSPFKYFDAANLMESGSLAKYFSAANLFGSASQDGIYRLLSQDGIYLLLSAALIAISVIAAYWVYNKRDLYI